MSQFAIEKNITQAKVSVIVPIYNMEKYLNTCLHSLVNQTLKEIEIILVNDGSTDGSAAIIEEYEKKYDNIIIINQENKGLSRARVIGIDKARGEYIGFVDADDFVKQDMYLCMYEAAVKNEADCVICNYGFYPQKVKTKEKWFKEYFGKADWNFIERNTQPWNKICKKTLVEKARLKELLLEGSDGAYINVLLNAEKIVTLNEELYFYRVGQASMSSSYKNTKKFINNIEITSKQVNYILGTKYEAELRQYFQYRIIYAIIQALIVLAYNGKKQEYIKWKEVLYEMKYSENPLLCKILRHNHGSQKAFIMINIVPNNFYISKLISKIVLKR